MGECLSFSFLGLVLFLGDLAVGVCYEIDREWRWWGVRSPWGEGFGGGDFHC